MSGCIPVSLAIYESDNRIQADEKLSGEFFNLYNQDRYTFEPMPTPLQYVRVFHSDDSYKKYGFHAFRLNEYKGFGIRLESLGREFYSGLETEAAEQLYSYEKTILRPWFFGAYEQFDDVFVLYFPRVEGVEQLAEEHGIRFMSTTPEDDALVSLDADTEKMMLVESSKRLEFVMGELLKSKMVIPVPLVPVTVVEQWPEIPSVRGDVYKLLRVDYPKLVERLEEFEEMND